MKNDHEAFVLDNKLKALLHMESALSFLDRAEEPVLFETVSMDRRELIESIEQYRETHFKQAIVERKR